jgi:PHD/YefM family antitoxin component YafN of YafNO toxin-antitoxin module
MKINPRFITDINGKKTAVQLSLKEFEYLIEELELKDDIGVFEKIKSGDKDKREVDWEVVKKKLDKNTG